MRAITQNAVSAFNNAQNFRQSNTKVVAENGTTKLYLHNNLIAVKDKNGLQITDSGWQSNTTKERLNGLQGVSITQKNWQWYLNGKKWDGSLTKV